MKIVSRNHLHSVGILKTVLYPYTGVQLISTGEGASTYVELSANGDSTSADSSNGDSANADSANADSANLSSTNGDILFKILLSGS